MLYYDRIDVSEEIDLNKTKESKECCIRYYSVFYIDVLHFKLMAATGV